MIKGCLKSLDSTKKVLVWIKVKRLHKMVINGYTIERWFNKIKNRRKAESSAELLQFLIDFFLLNVTYCNENFNENQP